jgi:type IV secretory pathway TraG/TraD family ATPase VirD4
MTWDSLGRGTNGVLLMYGITLAGFVAMLIRRRVPARGFIAAPFAAVPPAIAGLLLAAVLTELMMGHTALWLRAVVSVAAFAVAGLGGALWMTRREPRSTLWRGTVIARAPPALPAQVGAVTLAGVEIPAVDETKHFKLLGVTGSGKSTAIRGLLKGALARGDRAIIADPDGGYLESFYVSERGDALLNPFEDRSVHWDLFGEIEKPYDVEHLSRALIADSGDPSSREWRGYARTFLASLLEYCKLERPEIAELWRLLAVAEPEELRDILAGTAAHPFLAEGAAKMFHSIRGTAAPALAALKFVEHPGARRLSLRRWVREGRGVLFLPYHAGEIAALRSLLATWLRLAIFESMAGGEGDRRLWFVIDELDALGAIDGLKDALARLRKFGGRCVLGFQSIAQVRGTYGDAEAQTIVENCGNTLILRCSASEHGGTAEFASRLIGQREVVRKHVAFTSGGFLSKAHSTSTTSYEHVTEDAVMASEIEQLPDLAGFLKVASRPEWRRVTVRAS